MRMVAGFRLQGAKDNLKPETRKVKLATCNLQHEEQRAAIKIINFKVHKLNG
jgi:hypothetical protein